MGIDIELLEKAISTTLSAIKEQSGNSIHVPVDYYWSIPAKSLFDVYVRPAELSIGQVSEDWNWLQEIAEGKKSPTPQAMAWLASILTVCAYSLQIPATRDTSSNEGS
jgi:hypothetical protein